MLVDSCDKSLVLPWDFKDPQLATNPKVVPKDASVAAVVVEQLARLAMRPNLDFLAHEVVGYLEPMMYGFPGHLMLLRSQDGRPDQGVLLDGCFNYPKQDATNNELVRGTAYFHFALYYLKTVE
jgi:hypothetical protein